jgi:hypothetical protein
MGNNAGRVCIVCKDRQPYDNFRRPENGLGRICRLCRAADAHVEDYARVCAVCEQVFKAHRDTARYCSDDCRYKHHTRRVRQARRVARARKVLEAAQATPRGLRARTDLDHA